MIAVSIRVNRANCGRSAREFDAAWSPDGTRLALNSNRLVGRYSLFRRAADGSGEYELLVRSIRACMGAAQTSGSAGNIAHYSGHATYFRNLQEEAVVRK